jgi:hypothetical protein
MPDQTDPLEIGEPGDDGRYPAEIVQRLRQEAAERRTRARESDEASQAAAARTERALHALWEARRDAATRDLLADPTDLDGTLDMLDDDGLPDSDRIRAAAEALVAAKPHLASRRPAGDIDQGARGTVPEPVNLAAIIRQAAN